MTFISYAYLMFLYLIDYLKVGFNYFFKDKNILEYFFN